MKTNYLILSALLLNSYNGFTQNNASFVVHEWGTFTTLQNSNGKLLNGLHIDEEKLPSFTFDFSKTPGNEKGLPINSKIANVKVKMETPVLYFYSDIEQAITVDVKFKNGSISQWYPNRIDGEKIALTSTDKIDFEVPRTGWIKWEATVLPPNDNSEISSKASLETPQWVRPRATASNLIKVNRGEISGTTAQQGIAVEKFLFYRGVASFNVPVKVEFNKVGKLVITNNFPERLNYVMVYEKKPGQCASVWWAGAINQNRIKVITKPATITDEADLEAQMITFENSLVEAGLYRDEAKSMLNTWKESYFEHEGLKVFWIAPRVFTEEILPITITPQPNKLERVIVGRSEILSPSFETELQNSTDFAANWSKDRFYLAYTQLRNEGIPNQWTTINDEASGGTDEKNSVSGIKIYPNPAKNQLRLSTHFKQAGNLHIQLFNITGTELFSTSEKVAKGEYNKLINIAEYASGLYFLKVESEGEVYTQKIIKDL